MSSPDSGSLSFHDDFAQQFAAGGIEPQEMNAAVQEHVAARRAVQTTPSCNEHAAVYGPGGFELLPGHHAAVQRCAAETPGQRAVLGAQGVDVAVGRAEQDKSLVVGGRRVDSAAGRERPQRLARCRRPGRVRCACRPSATNTFPAAMVGALRRPPSSVCQACPRSPEATATEPAPLRACVVPVGRPVSAGGVRTVHAAEGRPLLQTGPGVQLSWPGRGTGPAARALKPDSLASSWQPQASIGA